MTANSRGQGANELTNAAEFRSKEYKLFLQMCYCYCSCVHSVTNEKGGGCFLCLNNFISDRVKNDAIMGITWRPLHNLMENNSFKCVPGVELPD